MKCTNCGFENEENARFCESCGASLTETVAEAVAEQVPENVEVATEVPQKKCCKLLKNKKAIFAIAAAAIVLLLVIVISAIANSGNGFIERECDYEIVQNEDGDLIVLNGKKLLKDKIDIETPEEADWDIETSIDGKVAVVWVDDVQDDEEVVILYVIRKNKITKIAEGEDFDYILADGGNTVVYAEYTEDEETKEETETLYSYNVKNGKSKEIFKSDEESYVSGLAVSPDGKTVVYTVAKYDDENDDVKYLTYLYNGKGSEKIISSDVRILAISNKAKYIYGIVEEEKEDGEEYIAYVYNNKGEKQTKLGAIDDIDFNADYTQAIYTVEKGEKITSYLSIKGKEGVKIANGELDLITNGIDVAEDYYGWAYPVENLYDHVYRSVDEVKYDEKTGAANTTYNVYLVKKGEGKTVKLVSDIAGNYTLDKSAEYLYYMEADDDNVLMVLKIAKGDKAKDKAKTIADDVDNYVVTSDRKKVYFVDEDTLCKVNGKKGGKAKTIASEVMPELFINDKDIVYFANEDEELYATTGKKAKKIADADEMMDSFFVDGELYIVNEDNDLCYVNKTKKPEKVATMYSEEEAAE